MGRQTRLFVSLSTLGAGLGAMTLSAHPASAAPSPDGGPNLWAVAAPTTTPSTPAPLPTVTVNPGDTLSGVAATVNRTWPQLAGYNHLANANLILPGQVLRIPPASYAPATPTPSNAVPSTNAPVVTHPSSVSAGSGLEACILYAESRGNPNARNGQYWGAYQFSEDRWVAAGGSKADYGTAGFAEQQQVFDQAIAEGMASAWTAYDGC